MGVIDIGTVPGETEAEFIARYTAAQETTARESYLAARRHKRFSKQAAGEPTKSLGQVDRGSEPDIMTS